MITLSLSLSLSLSLYIYIYKYIYININFMCLYLKMSKHNLFKKIFLLKPVIFNFVRKNSFKEKKINTSYICMNNYSQHGILSNNLNKTNIDYMQCIIIDFEKIITPYLSLGSVCYLLLLDKARFFLFFSQMLILLLHQ